MDPAVIFIILLIIGVIVLVIWFLIVFSRRRAEQIRQLSGQGTDGGSSNAPAAGAGQAQTGWGDSQPISGPRGQCGLYTFSARGPGQPAIPTLNESILDNLTPGELGNVTCTDPDQLALQKV